MPNEIEVSNVPNVTVIRNGKLVDTSAIDNYDEFMTYLMTASIAANTAKIRRYHEDRTSLGGTQSFNLNITPTFQEIRCIHRSQSIHLINDGPGQIFIALNNYEDNPAPINPRGDYTLNFETHKLERFYVWSAPGTVATARAWVKY